MEPGYLYGRHTFQRACIASLAGDKERAVDLLRQAIGQGFSSYFLLSFHVDLEPLRGYPPFEELRRPKG